MPKASRPCTFSERIDQTPRSVTLTQPAIYSRSRLGTFGAISCRMESFNVPGIWWVVPSNTTPRLQPHFTDLAQDRQVPQSGS